MHTIESLMMDDFVGPHFWARGYFMSTVGRDETVILPNRFERLALNICEAQRRAGV